MLRRDMRLLGFSVLALGVRPPERDIKVATEGHSHLGTPDDSQDRAPSQVQGRRSGGSRPVVVSGAHIRLPNCVPSEAV